ncbi:MAG: helix-turn-helix transcriptional regulator [Lachnospiraceae bacterium]|nr:helix-turn-helix transcriptional regulator [Lachnospiraceae bacterium]
MFHRAVDLQYKEGTLLEITFRDGVVKQYDVSVLFERYPQLQALKDPELFRAGKLQPYGIIWNDELDLEAETVYQEGKTVKILQPSACAIAGDAVLSARARRGLSQKQLAAACGIDQADLSRIERGLANPSVGTLKKIADSLQTRLIIQLEDAEKDQMDQHQ